MTTETSPLLSAKAESYGGTEGDTEKEGRGRERVGPGRGYMLAILCGLCFTAR